MRLALALMVLSFALPALAADACPVPPKPPTSKLDRYQWARTYERCLERNTKWSRDRCLRILYTGR